MVDDYHDLSYLDKPTCPHCERELGVAPGMGGLAFKCARHGKFDTAAFEANALDVMQRRQTDTSAGGSIMQLAPLAVVLLPFAAGQYISQKVAQLAQN